MPRRRNRVFAREIPKQHTDKGDQKANQTPGAGARSRPSTPNSVPSPRQFHLALTQANISLVHTQETVSLVQRSLKSLTKAIDNLHSTFHQSDKVQQKKPCSCKSSRTAKGDNSPHKHCLRCDKRIPSESSESENQTKNKVTITIKPDLPTAASDSKSTTLPEQDDKTGDFIILAPTSSILDPSFKAWQG